MALIDNTPELKDLEEKFDFSPTITGNSDLTNLNPDYDSIDPHYKELEDCFNGGGSIENAGDDVYLIKKTNENSDDYKARKRRSVYYNKCAQVISTFQGHLWRKAPIREMPESLEQYIQDVDKQGTTANDFFRNITEMAQVLGLYFVYVDFPQNLYGGNQPIAIDKQIGLRPKMIPVDPRNILDWSYDETGFKYIVIAEETMIIDYPFLQKETETHYRLIYPNIQFIYRRDIDGKPVLLEERENTLGIIPLVPFYGKKISKMCGQSVLHDICGLNLELYNKHTQRDMAEFWSAFPIPFFKMFDITTFKDMGPQNGLFSMDPDADVKLIEFSGNSIKALKEAEEDILREIFDLSLKQIRANSAQKQTVESKRLDRLDALSDLQNRALQFQEAERTCWEYFGMWLDIEDDIEIIYNIDYNISQMETDLIDRILTLKDKKIISKKTVRQLLESGEILPDDFDSEEEDKNIEKETPETNNFNPQGNEEGV